MMATRVALLCVSSLLLLLTGVHAQSITNPPVDADGNNIRMFAFLQLQYVSITKIDGVEQSFSSDFYGLSTWAAPKHSPNVTTADDLNALSDLYWQPQLDFINAIGGINALVTNGALSFIDEPSFDPMVFNYTLPDDYIWCTLDQRYTGDFLTPVEMQSFPYDQQKALLLIESFWDTTQVQIVFAQPDHITLKDLFPPTMPDILGWHAVTAETQNLNIAYAYNGRTYNRLILSIVLNRLPEFYLNKLVAGCVMLVALCICLFLLTAEEADRLMGGFAIFAGLVAYLFVASVYTPVLPYSTALDQFLMLCFVEVIAMCGVHGVMFYIREREKMEEEKLLAEAEKKEKELAADDEDDFDDDDDDSEEDEDEYDAAKKPQKGAQVHSLPGEVELASPSLAANFIHTDGAGEARVSIGRPVTLPPLPIGGSTNSAGPHAESKRLHHGSTQASARSTRSPREPVDPAPVTGVASTKKHLNKRERKRARKAAAQARRRQLERVQTLQQPVMQLQVTSLNPVRLWWSSLGLTRIRKLDVFFAVFFTLTFVIATAIIFGIPASKQ